MINNGFMEKDLKLVLENAGYSKYGQDYIFRAVNCHDDLLKACKELFDMAQGYFNDNDGTGDPLQWHREVIGNAQGKK